MITLLCRQPHPYLLDDNGAWSVRIGEIEIIGLNCVPHWRRFKDGAQLKWLDSHLQPSDAAWHIIMPRTASGPQSQTQRYQALLKPGQASAKIVDAHEKIIFISGHTHVSMDRPMGCVEHDKARNNIYINDGSIRPTTRLTEDGRPEAEPADGNTVELLLTPEGIVITSYSTVDNSVIAQEEIRI